MNNQRIYTAGSVEYSIDPKTGNRKSTFRGDKAYPDYDSAVKAANVLRSRGHAVVAVDGEVISGKAMTLQKPRSLFYKIRAFQKGKPNPVKFNCRAENIPAAMQMFAIVTLFAGVQFERFTFQGV